MSSLGPLIESAWWLSIRRYWVGFASGRRWVGFAGAGLDLPALDFVGGVNRRWAGFACVGVDSPVLVIVGLDLPALVLPTLVLPGLILRRWVGSVAVGRHWDSSPLGGIVGVGRRWAGFTRFGPPAILVSNSFAASHPPPSPPLPASFLPLSLSAFSPPHRGWITKTDHDKRRGSCFVTHNRGLPLHGSPASSSLPGSSVERDLAAHIPLKRGGTASAASSLVREPKRC